MVLLHQMSEAHVSPFPERLEVCLYDYWPLLARETTPICDLGEYSDLGLLGFWLFFKFVGGSVLFWVIGSKLVQNIL